MKHGVRLAVLAAVFAGCQRTTETGGAARVDPPSGQAPGGRAPGGDAPGERTPPAPDVPPPAPEDERVNGDARVPPSGAFALRDAETGTLWNLRGEAFDGPLAEEGRRLHQLPAYTAFWFAWSVFEAQTDVWSPDGPPEPNDVTPIVGSGGCEVPCNEIISGGPPKDGIPSLDHNEVVGRLTLVPADDPKAAYLGDEDRVLGVVLRDAEGHTEARAYSHNVLWWHEIANDTFGDRPFSVTFCPLTGSGIVFPGGERGLSFGTSGRLFNSNLVMYGRVTDSLFSQMLRRSVTGPLRGEALEIWPVVDTTWSRWRALWPDTRVTADDTGHRHDYQRYPYGDYREDDEDTFRPTRPPYDRRVRAKALTLGVRVGPHARAYVYERLDTLGARAVVSDELDGVPVVIVWDRDGALALPFDRRVADQTLTFEVVAAP